VAAITEAGGARCVPCGVVRALCRVVLLGGLIVAGWLLGSGIGLASTEGSGEQAGSAPPVVTALLGANAVGSAIPLWPGPASARLGVLTPQVNTSSVVRPVQSLARPLASRTLVSPTLVSPTLVSPTLAALSQPVTHDDGIRSSARVEDLAVVSPHVSATSASSATSAVLATAPVFTATPAVRPAIPQTMAENSLISAAHPAAARLALGADPGVPVPASPLGKSTSLGMIVGPASGTGTKSSPYAAVSYRPAEATFSPVHRLLYLSVSDLPPSPAARPSTAPD